MNEEIRIFPLGDAALTVEFGNVVSVELNERAVSLSSDLEADPFPGMIETIPAYASTTVIYDPREVRKQFPGKDSPFAAVRQIVKSRLADRHQTARDESKLHVIPVSFGGVDGPDLEEIAALHKVSPDEVIAIFAEPEYRVFMLGFLPGFSYMGEVDERIARPRRATPRTLVQKGSIGIAGSQTGIYSLASPGGWQIIGRSLVETFDPLSETPSLFRPGDRVRFEAAV